MPHFEWQRSDPFRDHAHDRTVSEGEVVELSEHIAAGQPGFVKVDADDEGESDDENTESDDEDYAAMDYAELRQLAVDADTDEIDGRSAKDDIVAWLEANA